MRRRITAAVAASTVLAAGTGLATALAGRWASGTALGAAGGGRPAGFAGIRFTVHGSTADTLTLTRSTHALRPGTYRLTGRSGSAVVGSPLDVAGSPDTVVRQLIGVGPGRLPTGSSVGLTPQLYTGTPRSALGIEHTDVELPHGSVRLPAWLVPGPRDTWIIALHGLGATRELPLNVLPFLQRLRFPVLLPAFRGDPGAPRRAERAYRLGAGEWRDAEAALRFAVRAGARRVVLFGWSTGATMALHTATHSPLHRQVAGLVLDSPVLWPTATLRAMAVRRGVPAVLRPWAVAAAQRGGAPADPPPVPPPGERGAPPPMLLVHGPDDTIAPFAASRELAGRHERNVVLHTVAQAQHAAMWNADPDGYEEALRRFLTPLM
ncbi:alpha/beta hydrolase [Streptomyces sp. NBRC 109706]|uniref:alpha/beta hydrolase n=1 Tax=Streptomyces sp. NBRC 109706 TaxID=1550035 RepID=UPI00078097D0|nr:alpha/beta fold hydrolase [Streptomyces sp. NBRC 109706]